MVCKTVTRIGISFLCCLAVVAEVSALPFNDDMVHDQFKTSEVMRAAPEGSVPVGAHRYHVDAVLATKNLTSEGISARAALKNPVPSTDESVARGKRLWAVNCSPCHGTYTGKEDPAYGGSAKFLKSIDPAVAGATSGPNLVTESYLKDPSKSDGHIFSYIHFGGLAVMPRYGYKLSLREHWDVVNYIRWMQSDFTEVMAKK